MSFQITAKPSGLAFTTDADETILDAALKAKLVMQHGCKSGACGACKCKIIRGEVSHGQYQPHALSNEEKENGMTLACCATAKTDLIIEATITGGENIYPTRQITGQVYCIERFNEDTMIIRLQLPVGERLDFNAGQYLNFILKDGARRSYSMASLPASKTLDGNAQSIELHIRLMPSGKFTTHVFNALKEGDQWEIEGPLGTFYLREESKKTIIFIASGTGFAPVKGILEYMQSKNIQRQAILYWGGRRPKDLYMNAWLQKQLKAMPHLNYIPVISDALPEDNWQGRTGFVHQAVMQDHPDMSAYQVYACGTPVMVDAAHKDFLAQCELPEEEFYMDSFTKANDK